MMKKLYTTIMMIALIALIGLPFGTVNAESTESQNVYSISPLDPETDQPQSNYFDLKVTPNEQKQVKVRIFNSSAEDIKVNVAANDGTTNDNGITSYLGEEKRDTSLKVAFSDIATLENNQLTVPKNGSVDAIINLKIPEKEFDGTILGGIRVSRVGEGTAATSKTKAAVKNNIAYTVAVVLKENDKEVDPQMNLLRVSTEQRNYRNYFTATIQNAAPRIIKKLEVTQKIYKKGDSKVLYEASNSDMRMAPNSNFNFGVSLEDQPFKAGTYTIKVTGKADGKDFSFEKDLTITNKSAAEWNENAVFVKDQPQNNAWLYLGILLLSVLLILAVSYMVYLRRKGKANENVN